MIAEFKWDGNITGRQLAREHKTSKTRNATWQACFKMPEATNIDTFHDDEPERPNKLDSENSANLCKFFNQKRASQDTATPDQVTTKILEEIKASYERRGIGNIPGTS